jgi:hypothetical protein
LLKEILSKVSGFHDQNVLKFEFFFISSKLWAVSSKTNKMIPQKCFNDQFPSKSIKASRKIGRDYYSVKSVRINQRSLTTFLMQVYTIKKLCERNLYQVFDRKL